jgi:hypothetical protein
MKKILLTLLLTVTAFISGAQTFSPKIVTNGIKNTYDGNLKSTNWNSGVDVSYPMTMTTPALQLTFTQLEKSSDGNWRLTTPIYVGYSYIFSYARGVLHQDSSLTVENHFFFGGGFNFGVMPNENGVLVGSLPVGGIVGYSRYGAFGGIDVLSGKPILGVSVNIINVPILQKLTRFNIKKD